MNIGLLVMTDGRRDHIADTVASFDTFAAPSGNVVERWIHDDTGDPAHREWLADTFPGFEILHHPAGRQGFGGAIRSAWEQLRQRSTASHIFHLEDDFTFRRPVDLTALGLVLDARPHLAQLALRRQPWNDHERAAGGIVEQHPDAYAEVVDGPYVWLEHRLFFTTNPGLYPRRLIVDHDWPTGANSEGRFTFDLLDDPDLRFAYWGARASGEWVQHNGTTRNGTGY